MTKNAMNCPNGHGAMQIKKLDKSITFRGVDITFQAEYYVCLVCGIEVGTIDQAAATQRAISDAYRKMVGLLTGKEIRERRKKLGLTQDDLARRMSVGIASIKRWEGGLIQSKSMDKALRTALQGQTVGDIYTGNRVLSIPRIKLVLRQFESILGKRLLVKNDRMLYAAKYLWYADMVAFRELGESMTGSTYARLPWGPQLNNYRDLIDEIKNADETMAEPLTVEEKRIITRIAKTFPKKSMVYQATHNEIVWERKTSGELIPYTNSAELTEI
ncbi:MAG: type II toxin-antitoxin system MqsA family antitoxin [Deltaproteobacteria bacterium]|nr:type II toxin-antitoxin system MqsA family antitoxin [Deltaproteobacteria bacterium]